MKELSHSQMKAIEAGYEEPGVNFGTGLGMAASGVGACIALVALCTTGPVGFAAYAGLALCSAGYFAGLYSMLWE